MPLALLAALPIAPVPIAPVPGAQGGPAAYEPLPAWCAATTTPVSGEFVADNTGGEARFKAAAYRPNLADLVESAELKGYPFAIRTVLPASVRDRAKALRRDRAAGYTLTTKTGTATYIVDRASTILMAFFERPVPVADARRAFVAARTTLIDRLGLPTGVPKNPRAGFAVAWAWDARRMAMLAYFPPLRGEGVGTIRVTAIDPVGARLAVPPENDPG